MKISSYFVSIGLSVATILSLSSCTEQNKNTVSNTTTMRTVHVEANRVVYKNFPDLKKSSDFVGIVQPIEDFQTRKHENNYMPDGSLSDFHTRTVVRVIKVFKGDVLPNTTMEIIEPISIIKSWWEDIKIAIDDYSELPLDKPSLVFLQKNTYGQLWVGNAQNSVFPTKKDLKVNINSKNDPDREEIYKWITTEKMLEE